MNPDALKDLLGSMGNACTIPTVPSRPLVLLHQALFQHLGPTCYGDLEDDDPLVPVIDAAISLVESWSYWPPDEFGSSFALVDSGAVEAMQDALAKYRRVAG
jgi:hypothetical protein